MKRKWLIPVIILGVLALFIILIWPMAPVWVKLGAKPLCIQDNGSGLKLVPCPGQEVATVAPIPLPTPGVDGPVPVIVDDDGSPDGMIAMLYFLRNPLFDVRAVTISYGEAHPEKFAPLLVNVLASFSDNADVAVGFGSDAPLQGTNAFPDPWREASDAFWGQPPVNPASQKPVPAPQLIVQVVKNSPQPVLIFVSGSHTNLAEALRLDPTITKNIRGVYIMGGAVNVPGNIHSDWPAFDNEVAEWNIWVDPLAAREVFSSGLDLHLIPLDATKQVTWTREDLPGWESSGSGESGLAAGLLQWMLDNWSSEGVYIWDLVAAVQATDLATCPEIPMGMDVVTAAGPEQGRTLAVGGSANISVCLEPDPVRIKSVVLSVFQQP
jgi:pyrimidine-specific ribonucleoside hydrolase